ncbi:alpha-1,2-mannosyltransferase (Mnn2) [Diplocarpon rosae]|nr:alpha-1,2-mannosyltransferase (Mnn2) [Diplocarpon rosae]
MPLNYSPAAKIPRRHSLLFALFALLAVFCHLYALQKLPELPSIAVLPSLSWLFKPSKFWHAFAPVLAATGPECAAPTLSQNAAAELISADEYELVDIIDISQGDVESMRRSHALFVDLLEFGPPSLDYKRGTKGVVTRAQKPHIPILLVNLLMLRCGKLSSDTPVEVFLATPDEYEEQVCDVILPALNAKCIVLSRLLDSSTHKYPIAEEQLDILAIAFSSFESVLYLDVDAFPLQSLETIFDSEPLLSRGLVLWPDLRAPRFAPQFSKITGLSSEISPVSPTVHGSQLLISKEHHAKTLLLAVYYSIHWQHYAPLIRQGRAMSGDFFLAAALVLNASVYTVAQPPHPLGSDDTKPPEAVLLQHEPSVDFTCANKTQDNDGCNSVPVFLASGWTSATSLNPFAKPPSKRQWGAPERSQELYGEDIEVAVWGFVVEVACVEELVVSRRRSEKTEVCERVMGAYREILRREYVEVER